MLTTGLVGNHDSEQNVGLLSMNVNALPSEHNKYTAILGDGDIYKFVMLGADFRPEIGMSHPNSLPLVASLEQNQRRLDALVFGASMLFFDTDWHRSLFCLAALLVKDGGSLFVPVKPSDPRTTPYGIELSVFDRWAGKAGQITPDFMSEYKVSDNNLRLGPSTLTWLSKCGPDYITRKIRNFEDCEVVDLKSIGLKSNNRSFAQTNHSFPGFLNTDIAYPDHVSRADFSELEYLAVGAGQKFAAIKKIYEKYIGKPDKVKILDHGSAAGLIPSQAFFESGMKTRSIVAVEALNGFCPLAYDFFRYLPENKLKLLSYENSYAEDYQYENTYHLIGFIHMFYLINSEARDMVLRRAMEALEPDGAVVFWEMPKTNNAKKMHYYDKMMTNEELVRLCSPYLVETYLNPRDMSEIDPEACRDTAVIRVIKNI